MSGVELDVQVGRLDALSRQRALDVPESRLLEVLLKQQRNRDRFSRNNQRRR